MSEPSSPTIFVPSLTVDDLQCPSRLVVDCRPQASFDQSHYKNAISLSFPAILWRRLLKQKSRPGCLDEFLMCDNQELKRRHEKGMSIVLYDEDTRDISDAPSTSPLRVLCEILLQEEKTIVFYLQGGFRKIMCARPDLVTSTQPPCFPTVATSWALPASPCMGENLFNPVALIWDFIAIGSEADAHNVPLLDRTRITHVLNLTSSCFKPEVERTRKCLQIKLLDTPAQDILSVIPTAIDFIQTARESGGRILVHCLAGISRSSAMVIAYIMWRGHHSLPEAYDIVRAHRACASPNLNFMGQLLVFGKCLCCKAQASCTPAQAALLATICLRKSQAPRILAPCPLPNRAVGYAN
eukprot:m.220889 g.220889  ORF g.220889 m.220889 type:complete len:354 (+) comp10476_c0_seq1:82-1143(+)